MSLNALGVLVRDLRSAMGWSQARLAEELCDVSGHSTATREDVSRWERGKRTPGPYWLAHLATVLEVPRQVLEGAKVDRRGFISSMAATAIAPVIVSDLIAHGFDAAIRAGGPDTEEWRERLATYGFDYMTEGAGEMQRRLAGDLVVAQQQLDTPRMWDIVAKLMTLFAKTFPGSDGSKAVTWYRNAIIAADRSENVEARVWVRGRAAIALGYEGASLGIADMLAEQALQISDKPSIGRLNALMGKAHAAALRGDMDAARNLLTEGRRVFDQAGSGDEATDYAVPYWRMNVFMSLLFARLGDETGAERAQETAREHLPVTLPRFKTHLDLHRGLMMVRAGDRPGGVEYGEAALAALPPERHSLTLRMLMNEIRAT
ncbi:helix-turn-helix domain-containing protein [Actinokineospora sp.]|uniref:helix-turn-helix domain-containing protein n=1 Tax=Actinokineospora sp. TaxID=1872133 RepID=UPI0040384A3A